MIRSVERIESRCRVLAPASSSSVGTASTRKVSTPAIEAAGARATLQFTPFTRFDHSKTLAF
jgi:hypothetical protein